MLDQAVIAQLIADIGDDAFIRLSRQFLDETGNRIVALTDARKAAAWGELARHAHSLKSTAQSFGLPETGAQARDLQVAADRLDIAAIDALLPRLIDTTGAECAMFEALCANMLAKRQSANPSSGASDKASRD
ncbi:MAG TPA: Hpt domain-containing protein [Dongiaceae bacterium]|nr:Hpt domain-containing protein [Dongiaceae bacterium]